MEVSQIAELDNHAILGGGKAHAFTMSESAEFFTVLSDTLYRDKKRAVVREIICNAWDAHKILGKTDPIDISLSDAEMSIRDHGPGIPNDKIGAIYCRYGASTKVKDDTQTGGFGLGSKAPFAYSAHFAVTNHHAGRQRVYAISRGGAETDGKPDFREMVNVPTEESGICVSIPLKNASDRGEFEEIIRDVIFGGGMRAKLNGVLVEGFDYSKATHGFCVVPATRNLSESLAYCLYGTVLYPIVTTDQTITREVNEFSRLFGTNARIILIAPPNTVGVTPSRESLSYTDRTIETLRDLIAKKSKMVRVKMSEHANKAFREITDKAAELIKKKGETFFNRELTTTDLQNSRYFTKPCMTLEDIASRAATTHLDTLVKNRQRKFRLALAKHDKTFGSLIRRSAYGPFQKNRRGVTSILMDHNRFRAESRLHVRMAADLGLLNNLYFGVIEGGRYSTDTSKLRALDNPEIPKKSKVVDTLYISFNHRDAIASINNRPGKKSLDYYSNEVYPVIVLSKKQNVLIDQIKERAKALKISVVEVDYTAPAKRKKPTEAEIMERNSFHSISQTDRYGSVKGDGKLAKKGDFYLRVNSEYQHYIEPSGLHDENHLPLMKKYFGDVLLVGDMKSEQRLKAMGCIDITVHIVDWLIEHMNNKSATYGWLRDEFVPQPRYGEVSQLVSDLIKRDTSYTKFFFPPKDKKFDEAVADKATFFRYALDRIRRGSPAKHVKEYVETKKKEIDAFKESAKKHYGDYFLTTKETKERFGQFDVLCGVQHYLDYNDKQEEKKQKQEELLEIFQYIDRKHKLKIKVRQKEEKEAAAKLPIPSSRALVIITTSTVAKESVETVEAEKEAA